MPLAGAQVDDRRDRAEGRDGRPGQLRLSARCARAATRSSFSKDGYVRQVKADVRRAGRASSPTSTSCSPASSPRWTSSSSQDIVEQLGERGTRDGAAAAALREPGAAGLDRRRADEPRRRERRRRARCASSRAPRSQDGKSAVIRGLPDRYVSSQMNGVRLPTADEDKRAVELDQFPAAVIESIQVSKTFTPDQQGDASGGAVDVRLKGIPDEPVLQVQEPAQLQLAGRAAKRLPLLRRRRRRASGATTTAAATTSSTTSGRTGTARSGVSADDAPTDYKWSVAGGRQARVRQRRQDRRLRQLLLRARQLVLRQRHRRLVLGRRARARR